MKNVTLSDILFAIALGVVAGFVLGAYF